MANKKISELAVRTPSLTDLMLVGDPSTGYSYKATLSALSSLLEANIALDDLNDVTITSPTAGQVLSYNGTAWVNSSDNGITSLNGLTALTQTFATGTSGTDFNIASATATHTFNLPTASATNRGALSSADWTTFNNKIGGSGTSGQVAYWTGTSSQSGSNNLFWDNANGRLGIGTNSPTVTYTQRQSQGVFARYEITNANANQNAANFDVYTNALATPDFFGRTAFKFEGGVNNASRQYQIYVADILNPKMVVNGAGNVIINSITDAGQRLQVNGDVLFKGSGNTSGTTALTVQNSAASTMMSISNDAANAILNITGSNYGMLQVNQTTANRNAYFASVSTGVEFNVGSAITNYRFLNTSGNGLMRINTSPFPTAGGDVVEIPLLATSFAPTSGSATATMLIIRPTINQTGGANGITRGLYVNPILTAAADWRSIEWSNNSGWGLYGAGSTNNYLAGSLGIGSTSLTGYNLFIQRNLTGAATGVFSIYQNSSIQSDVTGTANGIGSFTGISGTTALGTLRHFVAAQGTFAAGGTVTTQIGYSAASTLTGATNNYGFYGDIASGTGRWNLYMNGTADNYLAGNLLVATTSPSYNAAGRGNITIGGSSTSLLAFQTGGVAKGYVFHSGLYMSLWNEANGYIEFGTNNAERMRITSGGNVLIGSTTDGGQKLQVTGTMNVTGNTTFGGTVAASGGYGVTSGTFNIISSSPNVVPTSGTLSINSMTASPTINQTGGANGITRGLYINPTLTAAADWRAIETTQGSLRMADTYLAGSGSLAGSLIDLTQTWNTTGSPTLIKANVTNTASGASSLLMDLQVGGTSYFQVTKGGAIQTDSPTGGTKKPWKLGTVRTDTVVFDDSAWVEVEIDGIAYKLALAVIP